MYSVYTSVSDNCWELLSEQNQHDFKMSGTKGKCIEARELVIALPEDFVKLDPDMLLKLFTEQFHITYGVPCISALHHNKTKTNYHIHLIYSERKVKKEPVVFVNLKLCHFQWKFQLKIVPVFYYAPSVMVTQKEVERR